MADDREPPIIGYRDGKGRRWITLPSGYAVPYENTIFARDRGEGGARPRLKMIDERDQPVRTIDPSTDILLTRMLRRR